MWKVCEGRLSKGIRDSIRNKCPVDEIGKNSVIPSTRLNSRMDSQLDIIFVFDFLVHKRVL